jgi:DinB superfamily
MTDTQTTAPTREMFRKQMEETQVAFHQLLDSLSDADMKKKSGNGQFSNGQLLWHTAWGLSYVPETVTRCRSGKNLNMPRGVFNLINPWITRWGARGGTKEKIAAKYDEANAEALKVLETVKDDEWAKSCSMAGNNVSIESEFSVPANHFAEHKADILKSLGRA